MDRWDWIQNRWIFVSQINAQSSSAVPEALHSPMNGITYPAAGSQPLPSATPVLVQWTCEHIVYGGTDGVYV